MTLIFKQLKGKEWGLLAISVLFIVFQVWLDLTLPEYMQKITVLVQTPGSAMGEIWAAGGYMLLCALGSLASAVVVGVLSAIVAASLSKRLREQLFDKVQGFSMAEMYRFSTPSLITRSTNDVTQVQMVVSMGLQVFVKAPILAIWAIVKIAGKGVEWSVATGVAVVILVVLFMLVNIFVMPKFKKMQTLTDNLTKVTRENLTGLRVVRAYNAEPYQSEKFELANNEITKTSLFTNKAMGLLSPMISLVMNGLSLAIYWIGAVLINQAGDMERMGLFSDMIVFSSYAMQVIMAFMMLVMVFVMLPRALVSIRRIREVLTTQNTIESGTVTSGEPGKMGEVVFDNVSFRYPGAEGYVIKNVSFSAKQGETVAFIGSTGSGKSTLINLVPRFYDATEGDVLIDGVNIKDYQLESLYNKIGYVPQKAVLFRGTVASNVAYGDNGGGAYQEDEVKNAIRIAQGQDFVEGMDGAYEANIAQGGTNVSGGQKQRLAIARAVCRQPEIYVFDDSFSALDYKTDRVLRQALKEQTAGVTSLIVAQRIGTIMDADQIIVLEEGVVVGQGTHDELLKTCKTYQEIAFSQLSKEELAV